MNTALKVVVTIGAFIAAGAVLGVLYAPEEGVETRKKLMKRSKKFAGTVSSSIDDGKESLEEIKDVLQKQLNKVNRKIEEIRF
jgi:gas vesicle protein